MKEMILCNIIYSYKYLESDLIKHCHVIFIHSFGQPLIVRSHSKVRRSRGNPKEIITCFQLQLLPLIQQTTNMASSDRFVAVGEEGIVYIISNIFSKSQVFYYLVSDASPCVTLLFPGRQTVGSYSNKCDTCIIL